MLDPLELQRLVDGELDPASHRELLATAAENPDCWREIALALLEDQQFRSTLQGQAVGQLAENRNLDKKPQTAPNRKPDSLELGWVRWFAMAAAIAVSCLIGFQVGQSRFDNSTPGLANRSTETEPSDSIPLADGSLSRGNSALPMNRPGAHPSNDYVRNANMADLRNSNLSLQDAQGNEFSLPVVDYQQGQRYLNQRLPERTRSRLIDSGYNVDENIRYISGRLRDGRQIVFPVKSFRFSPGQ